LDILVKHISVDGAKSILLADIFYFNCKGHGFLSKFEMNRVTCGGLLVNGLVGEGVVTSDEAKRQGALLNVAELKRAPLVFGLLEFQ
jgi:hypothetical protein